MEPVVIDKAAVAEEILRRRRRNRLAFYEPYPKQLEFHNAQTRERMMIAGNQVGKTFSAGDEVGMHTSGNYPDWWKGHRFDRPITCWTGSESNETSREIIQAMLLGTEDADINHPDMGTGAIPGNSIVKLTKRQAGVSDVVDQIVIRHKNGGESRIVLKTYEQGRPKWQGKKVDLIWFDEEPPADIYSEGLTRTQDVPDGRVMVTFTPLNGMSEVVRRYLQPGEGDTPRHVTTMTIHDAGHYTDEQRAEIIASWPAHERDTRALGVPMMGEGKVFPVVEDEITCQPFEIPPHYARICGIDFGIDHPFAAVWLAWDRDTDTVYVYDCFRKTGDTPVYHAATIKGKQDWIPVAWPHDGMNKEKGSGKELHKFYREQGVKMLFSSARYHPDKGGSQPVEPVVLDMLERMNVGRFKVFAHLGDWFSEFRMYHRKDGKIVPVNDDLIAATRYAMMELRHAMVAVLPVRRKTAPVGARQWA